MAPLPRSLRCSNRTDLGLTSLIAFIRCRHFAFAFHLFVAELCGWEARAISPLGV